VNAKWPQPAKSVQRVSLRLLVVLPRATFSLSVADGGCGMAAVIVTKTTTMATTTTVVVAAVVASVLPVLATMMVVVA